MPVDVLPLAKPAAECEACRAGTKLPFALRMAFQPILDIRTGAIFAQEALVRGPTGQPAGWVIGQVDDTLRYAFDQACRVTAIREAAQLGLSGLDTKLSINFMPNAIYEPENCIRATLRAAAKAGFPITSLMFEVTEAEKVRDGNHLRRIVACYKAMGFAVALDDFGAGYAGLNLLTQLMPDIVKLDMDLLRGIDSDPVRRIVVSGCLTICRDLGVTVIAEGIEQAAELQTLQEMGVHLFQGSLFADAALGRLPVPRLPG